MARRRSLRPEEIELWQAVTRSTRPLQGKAPVFLRNVDAPPHPVPVHPADPPAHLAPQPRLPLFRLGEKARLAKGHDLATPLAEALAAAPVQMDAKAFGRMTRGKLPPQDRIDLHGMTLSEAHPALIRFVLGAESAGLRLVLVITGKGKRGADSGPIPQRVGALRHQVPQWLRLPPLGPMILQVAEAHLSHGGSGAYYVYLRRGR